MIMEGIADYFSATTHGINCKVEEHPKSVESYTPQGVYPIGFHLVHELIEEHGNEIIDTLILNPPVAPELEDLEKYKSRIRELVKQ